MLAEFSQPCGEGVLFLFSYVVVREIMIPRLSCLPVVSEFIRDLGLRLGLLTAKPEPLIPAT